MSALTRPQGPLPARVYWTRRLLVLGVCALLVFTLGRALDRGSDGKSDTSGTAAQVGAETTPVPSVSSTATATNAAKPGATKKQKPKKARTPLPDPDGPCVADDLRVVPTITRAHADDRIRIDFKVRGSEPACSWAVSPDSMAVKITSGSDLIWTSQHCPKALPAEDLVVRERKPATFSITWNGRRSDEECSRLTDWALPGWYHVSSAALGGEPTDRQFELRRPPAEKVTKAAKPKKKADKKRRQGSRPTDEPLDGERDGSQEPNG